MTARTSLTHPLQIADVTVPGAKGAIGITFCPGKKQNNAMSGAWERDLGLDLDAIKAWGAATVITLVEPQEIRALKVDGIEAQTLGRGMEWLHMPITDVSTPDDRFESAWKTHGARLIASVREGSRVLVHCKGGLGRAGTVAALMLVELGMEPEQAIATVRRARPGAIETPSQEAFIMRFEKTTPSDEIILSVGAEGGTLTLAGRRQDAGWQFQLRTSETALRDEGDVAASQNQWLESWSDAVAQLEAYPWRSLYPLALHPEFRKRVADLLGANVDDREHETWERLLT